MERRPRLWLAGLAWLTVTAMVAPPAAFGAGAAFSLTPLGREPYFVYAAAPGQSLSGQVRVINVGTVAGAAALSAVDATTGQTSGAVYQTQGGTPQDVGSWISLSRKTVTLGPHQSAVVSFTLHVPTQVRPGQHLGGVVAAPVLGASTRVAKSGPGVFRVNVDEISVVAVQVNIAGSTLQRLDVHGVSVASKPGYQAFLVALENAGDTLLKAQGRLAIDSVGGGAVLSQPFTLDTLVPRTSIQYPIYVHGRLLPPGAYRAQVSLAYGGGHHVDATFPVTISAKEVRQTYGSSGAPASGIGPSGGGGASVPVWLLVLAAVLLLVIGIGGSTAYQRRRPQHH